MREAPRALQLVAAAAALLCSAAAGDAAPLRPAPSAPAAAQWAVEGDLRRLERTVREHARGASVDTAELRERLAELRFLEGPLARRLETSLCTMVGAAHARGSDADEVRLLALLREVLHSRLVGPDGAAARQHLERGILLRPLTEPSEARAGAALVLAPVGKPDPRPVFAEDSTRTSLLAATGDPDPEVAGLALDALVGEPTARLSLARAALAELRASRQPAPRPFGSSPEPPPTRALERLARHEAIERAAAQTREGVPAPLEAPEAEAIHAALAAAWLQGEWRQASAAVRSATVVPALRAAGPLVEALDVWNRRSLVAPRGGGPTTGAVRVQGEIVAVLELHAGVALGPGPARWRSWLAALGRGETALVGTDPDATRAEFFGLPLQSGAVAFLLDASGSMASPMVAGGSAPTTAGTSRFRAAQRELLAALARSPEPIWFEVVLFESSARRYAAEPRLGTPEERERLAAWLAKQEPGGATRLGEGLSALWPPQPGTLRLATSPCDTVVVLCDGATVEDGADASAFLARGPGEDRVRFHALQIGMGPADAIETLARESGGLFLRIAQ